jgi:endo-1,4-beta-xylanase
MKRALVGAVISVLLLGTALYIGYFLIKEPRGPDTLRFAAQTRKLLIGAAVAARPLSKDPTYAQTLAREFNMLVPENAMKFAALHPNGPSFQFADADAIVDFAITHGMRIRGHTLVWWGSVPQWLIDSHFPSSEIAEILKNHIHTVVDRYRGRIYAWDVVNEAIGQNSRLADTIWSKALGADYIAQAFIWAHQADPAAKLFYNDYGSELLGPRSDAIYRLLQNLMARGIPVNGVGVQSHLLAQHRPDFSEVAKSLERLAALGLEIHITELDVRIELPVTDEKLQQQAEVYRRYLGVCLSIPNCKVFAMWGFTDKYSWIPKFSPGSGAALPFDSAYGRKPAYYALRDALYGGVQ